MSRNQKLVAWIVGILAVVWVTSNPTGSAQDFQGLLNWLGDGANAVITFIRTVFN